MTASGATSVKMGGANEIARGQGLAFPRARVASCLPFFRCISLIFWPGAFSIPPLDPILWLSCQSGHPPRGRERVASISLCIKRWFRVRTGLHHNHTGAGGHFLASCSQKAGVKPPPCTALWSRFGGFRRLMMPFLPPISATHPLQVLLAGSAAGRHPA